METVCLTCSLQSKFLIQWVILKAQSMRYTSKKWVQIILNYIASCKPILSKVIQTFLCWNLQTWIETGWSTWFFTIQSLQRWILYSTDTKPILSTMIVYVNTMLKIFLNILARKIDFLENLRIFKETQMFSIRIGIDRKLILLLFLEVI